MAKFKIEWSSEAKSDLINILNFYIIRNGSAIYSRKLLKRINNNLKIIIKNPFIGVSTDESNVRTFISGNYQIIYEITPDTILVIMLWDCRRNPEENKYLKK